MECSVKKPTFAERSELVRYIHQINRLSGNRPAVAAFLDPPSADPKPYLSVNSLQVESLQAIAAYHRDIWQGNRGRVALSSHKVSHYTDAGRKCGIQINYDRTSSTWIFQAGGANVEAAYEHHPRLSSDQPKSSSHCGVEFIRALKDRNSQDKFARQMIGSRFHLV
jgi:hypothetical protein